MSRDSLTVHMVSAPVAAVSRSHQNGGDMDGDDLVH